MILGGNCKPGDTVLVHPKHLQAAMEKASENGYRLRGPGVDSDTVVLPPVVDLNLPIVARAGNPGRKVVEVRSGTVYPSVKEAAKRCKVSEQSVYMACRTRVKFGGSCFGTRKRYEQARKHTHQRPDVVDGLPTQQV